MSELTTDHDRQRAFARAAEGARPAASSSGAVGAPVTGLARPGAPSGAARSAPTARLAPIRRMSTKAGKLKGEITSLAGLNAVIKDLKLKGGAIDMETIEESGKVKGAVTQTLVDAAVAGAGLEITTGTARSTIIAAIADGLNNPKKAVAVDPMAGRKDAAKRCLAYDKGEYFGGAANEPHVHNYGKTSHLKLPPSKQYVFVVGGTLNAGQLAAARLALEEEGMGDTLHAAIDKALIKHKIDLDT